MCDQLNEARWHEDLCVLATFVINASTMATCQCILLAGTSLRWVHACYSLQASLSNISTFLGFDLSRPGWSFY